MSETWQKTYIFIKLLLVLIGISFLSMYREVLGGSHGGWFNLQTSNMSKDLSIQSIYTYLSIYDTYVVLQGSTYLFTVLSWKFILYQPYVWWMRKKTCSPTKFPSPQNDVFLSYMSQVKKRSARGCSGIFNVNFEYIGQTNFPSP